MASPSRNLNFGCFDQVVEGWINCDITPHILIARVPLAPWFIRRLGLMTQVRYEQHKRGIFRRVRYLNLTRRFPFPDGSIDNAFSAHVIEHLYPEQAIHCVNELHRVLRVGGILRISVPDLDEAIRTYDSHAPEVLLELIYNATQKREKNRHHWMYNEHSMRRLLREADFREIQRCGFREGRCPDLDKIDNRPEGSLFMEAVK